MTEVEKLQISISREHSDVKGEISEIFKDLNASVKADYVRLSESELAMQVIIFLTTAFAGGALWDVLKWSIKELYKKHPKAMVEIRDSDSIMYAVKGDLSITVIVAPDRAKEFEHINTLDDLRKHLESTKR